MAAALGENHKRTIFAWTSLATAFNGVGRYEDAVEIISQSLRATAGGPDHLRYDRLHAMNRLAEIHRDNGNFEDAQKFAKDAIATWEAMGVLDNPMLSFVDVTYAQALTGQGETQAASAHLKSRLEVFVEAFGSDDPNTARLARAVAAIR